MAQNMWVFDPQSGGVPIPKSLYSAITQRIQGYAAKKYQGKFNRIDVRFKGRFCYIDACVEPDVPENFNAELYGETREEHIERLRKMPEPLVRLRYFGDIERWTAAFFTYSGERYEPCVFESGEWFGTLEEAFDIGAVYL